MKPVTIIGMGLSPSDLTEKHKRIIYDADILMGGERHLASFEDAPVRKRTITRDLKGALEFIRANMANHTIVVLASGDPLFFGIGAYVVKALGPDRVEILPNISSIAAAFSRIKEPWGKAKVISLHGRDHEAKLTAALRDLEDKDDRIALFTDPNRNPGWLARYLLKMGLKDFFMGVFEQLGSEDEKFGWYHLVEAADLKFQEPNVIILKTDESQRGKESASLRQSLCLGLNEAEFEHEEGLITKSEIRAISLSKLQLLPHHTLWDLGAGSGSVGIEASRLLPKGKVFSVEQKPERVAQIRKNATRFQVDRLEVVHAVLPDGLDDLPDPDRVFIGGGGKALKAIIEKSASRLRPEGVMVINLVLMENIQNALDALRETGFQTELIQVQINRTREMPWSERLEAQNPVWIIRGKHQN